MVFIFSIAVIVFILIYLIPQFVNIYKTAGVKLNPITSFLVAASTFLKANLFYILITIVIFVTIIYVLYKHIKAFRYFLQTVFMKTPVLGKIIIYKEMTIFTKTFASLLKNNVFITDSISILGKITNNEISINRAKYILRNFNHIKLEDKQKSVKDYYPELIKCFFFTKKSSISNLELEKLKSFLGDEWIEKMTNIFDYQENSEKLVTNQYVKKLMK